MPNPKKSSAKKIHLNVDSQLHKKLRVQCALYDSSIQEFVTSLIENAVKDVTIPYGKKGIKNAQS